MPVRVIATSETGRVCSSLWANLCVDRAAAGKEAILAAVGMARRSSLVQLSPTMDVVELGSKLQVMVCALTLGCWEVT